MSTATITPHDVQSARAEVNLTRLRGVALRGLARMYHPQERVFAFRARRAGNSVRLEGTSERYTAMVLLGLAHESEDAIQSIVGADGLYGVCGALLRRVPAMTNLGDVALTLWAALTVGHPQAESARARLYELLTPDGDFATVELSWAISALCERPRDEARRGVRAAAARRLLGAFQPRSELFTHHVGVAPSPLREHVACFADLVYPIQALSRYAAVTGDSEALDTASRCAERMCSLLGPAGQWWWHYDARTGRVIERYPVYAVHQDAMAPMALFALQDAGGPDHRAAIERGLAWLSAAPELDGGTLIDEDAAMIWRKVARHEPRKLVRHAQAVATRIHPALRCPGVDMLFPAGAIDDECRPYHLGWLLYAWPAERAAGWSSETEGQA